VILLDFLVQNGQNPDVLRLNYHLKNLDIHLSSGRIRTCARYKRIQASVQKHSKVMSKAGLTILLTLVVFLLTGASHKTYAREGITLPSPTLTNKLCDSPLTQKLVALTSQCGLKAIAQTENSVKNEAKQTRTIAYATEPTTFVPAGQSPLGGANTTFIIEPTVIEPTVTQTPTAPVVQAPADNLSATQPTNLNSDLILELINAHRATIGKPAFLKDAALCQLATTRSTELYSELFVKGGLHSGLYNRNLPYWVTENAKYGSNEAGTVLWWLNSPIHRSAIEGDHVYSCGACQGTQCSQLFTSYTPKSGIISSQVSTKTAVAN